MDKNICTQISVSRPSQKDYDSFLWQGTRDRHFPQPGRQGNTDQKTQAHYLLLIFFTLGLALSCSTRLQAGPVTINSENTQHIQFKRIAATQYRFADEILSCTVKSSASFLLLPFKQKINVSAVHFDWKLAAGKLDISDAAAELKREGDDSLFKLGLMIAGPPQLPGPFAPKWLRQTNEALSFPSDRIIYIVADAKHPAGEHWPNPYNNRVEMIAAQHRALDSGWSEASYVFAEPVSVVGLWLMADGDNTGSSFVSQIKNIRLE